MVCNYWYVSRAILRKFIEFPHGPLQVAAQDWGMEAPNRGETPALPALAAVGIITFVVLFSIAGYLFLSAQ